MSSSSSRLTASISKTLNLRNIFTKNRIPSTSSPFPAFYSGSDRTLSTLAEPPLESSFQAQGKERGRWTKWLLFLPGAIAFGLGSWQISRRQDKIEMLEYRRKRLDMEPVIWNSISSSSTGELEFRRVMCEGVFDETKSIYVGPRSRSISGITEIGYYVITPLVPLSTNPNSMQSPILVNRGWVPRSWRDKTREYSQAPADTNIKIPGCGENQGTTRWKFWSKKPETVEGPVDDVNPMKVIGVIRGSENPSIFVPANDPSSGQWFYVDVPAIARAAGFPEDTVYIENINENINPSNPYPIPKDVNTLIRSAVMPQNHLNYTLTWYSLSAAVTFMAIKRIKPRKSRR